MREEDCLVPHSTNGIRASESTPSRSRKYQNHAAQRSAGLLACCVSTANPRLQPQEIHEVFTVMTIMAYKGGMQAHTALGSAKIQQELNFALLLEETMLVMFQLFYTMCLSCQAITYWGKVGGNQ